MLEQKFLWSFIDFFVFYLRNSLEKRTENSGVLLNWQWKYLSSIASTASLPFSSIKMHVMHQKLKFENPFRIKFMIQEMAFRLCTKQSVSGKSKIIKICTTIG